MSQDSLSTTLGPRAPVGSCRGAWSCGRGHAGMFQAQEWSPQNACQLSFSQTALPGPWWSGQLLAVSPVGWQPGVLCRPLLMWAVSPRGRGRAPEPSPSRCPQCPAAGGGRGCESGQWEALSLRAWPGPWPSLLPLQTGACVVPQWSCPCAYGPVPLRPPKGRASVVLSSPPVVTCGAVHRAPAAGSESGQGTAALGPCPTPRPGGWGLLSPRGLCLQSGVPRVLVLARPHLPPAVGLGG